jgi:hypothetical protein
VATLCPRRVTLLQGNPFLQCNATLVNLYARHQNGSTACGFSWRSGLPWSIWHQRKDMISNALQWPIEKTHQLIWNALQDYGRTEWKWTLLDLDKAPDIAYQDVLNEFDSRWGVKGLIVTRSNLVVAWKIR